MSQPRLMGQDNEISVQIGVEVIDSMAIVSSEMTFMLATKETGCLGETTDRVDEIFKGMSGTIEFQAGEPSALRIISVVVDRARRRAPPYPKITLKSNFTFPETGRRALIVVPDLKFGDIPINTGGREEHVSLRYSWRAETGRVVFI